MELENKTVDDFCRCLFFKVKRKMFKTNRVYYSAIIFSFNIYKTDSHCKSDF